MLALVRGLAAAIADAALVHVEITGWYASVVTSSSLFASLLAGIVAISARLAILVVLLAALATGVSVDYAIKHFALNTDTTKLVSPQLDWRKKEAEFEAIFPQPKNQLIIVIDGVTPELTQEAAVALDKALRERPDLFLSVRWPGGGPFFERNGLLFLPLEQTQAALDQMIAAQPFLGALAADPSLRGMMSSLSTALVGIERGQIQLERLARPIAQLNTTLNDFFAKRPAFLSWRKLMMEGEPDLRETRRIIEVLVKLDFGALRAGGKPSQAIRDAAKTLGYTPENGVTVRLTGPVAIFDEEFATLTENAFLIASMVIGAILLMLWFALRSPRLSVCVVTTILVGLAATTAIGLHLVHAFNIISVAFVALFVGLGIDFGIQFCVRYRAERLETENNLDALRRTGAGIGPSLTLAALAITAGFFGFLPTSYRGVAELGLIAGVGMALTFVLSITLLPALIILLKPPSQSAEVGYRALAPLDQFLWRFAWPVVILAAIAGVAAIATLPKLTFDFNLLNLRSRHVESISTLLDLARDPQASPNTLDVIVRSREEAAALSQQLLKLPEVAGVITIDDLLPKDQDEKLTLIADAGMLLDPTLNPASVQPAPLDAELVTSLSTMAASLRKAAGEMTTQVAVDARSLSDLLDKLASATPETRVQAGVLLTRGLDTVLGRVRNLLQAQPVTIEDLPADLRRDFLAPTGEVRVKVLPKGDPTDTQMISRFRAAVLTVAPTAIGVPVSLEESGNTIVGAFIEAGLWSFLAITLLLALALRRTRDVVLALAPLVLAGTLTLATCVLIGLKLNYANIIALPLLFGNRRRIRYLFRDGVAQRGDGAASIAAHPCGDLQRRIDRDRVWCALVLEPPGNGQHGRAADHFARLDSRSRPLRLAAAHASGGAQGRRFSPSNRIGRSLGFLRSSRDMRDDHGGPLALACEGEG